MLDLILREFHVDAYIWMSEIFWFSPNITISISLISDQRSGAAPLSSTKAEDSQLVF